MSNLPLLMQQLDNLTQEIFNRKLVKLGAVIIHDTINIKNITPHQIATAMTQAFKEAEQLLGIYPNAE